MRRACIQCDRLSRASEESEGLEWCDRIGSFDNGTCKSVLDLL